MNSFYINSLEPDPSFLVTPEFKMLTRSHINNRAKFPREPDIHCVPIFFLELFVKVAWKFTLHTPT